MKHESEPECPGPDCPMCTGEVCNLCNAGRGSVPLKPCEHDCIERHESGLVRILETPERVVRPTLHECDLISEWNSAIEAAAKECERRVDDLMAQFEVSNVACECSALRLAAQGIRALKKNTNAQT